MRANHSFLGGLLNHIQNLTIKTKLIILFVSFSLVLVLGVGIAGYRSSSEVIDSQAESFTESILQQVKDRVDEMRDEVLKVSIPIVINPSIQGNDLQSLDMADYITRKNAITSNLTLTMFLKDYICSIYICNNDGSIISSEPVTEADLRNFKDYTAYRTAIQESAKPVWTGVHENEFQMDGTRSVFSYVRSLYDAASFQPFGALVINIPASVLDNICSVSSDYNIFIMDRSGAIIYSRPGMTEADIAGRTYFTDIAANRSESGIMQWQENGTPFRVRYVVSGKGDWTYVAEVPVSYLRQNSNAVGTTVSIILLTGIAMSVAAAVLISSYLTTPLRKMIKAMKNVQNGDFDIRLDICDRSETGQLAETYVVMMNRIKELVEGIKRESREKREAEINTLQAQVTPHFIYNVLNSIRCMARVQKSKGIEDTADGLIGLLQLSISKNTVFVSVAEEIEITRKYVQIQNFRYGNKIRLEVHIESRIMEYMTLKFVLQPLVENAILHGLEPKGGGGTIRVSSSVVGGDLCFEVEDNGVGMAGDTIRAILSGEREGDKRFSGIGVRNINERLTMYFGAKYGIDFRSLPGEYTKAVLTMPIVEAGEVGRYG